MSRQKPKFTLNPKHENFVPGETRLELNSLDDITTFPEFLVTFVLLAPIVLIITCAAVGAPFIALGRELLFKHDSALTEAQITGCEVVKSVKSTSYYFGYSYQVDGQAYEGHFPASTKSCAGPAPGRTFQLRYMRADPTFSRPADDEHTDYTIHIVLCFVGPMILPSSLRFMIPIARYPKVVLKMKRLRERGILLEGKIIAARGMPGFDRESYNARVIITYQFTTPNQVVLRGTSGHIRDDPKDRRLPPAESPVTVIYADDQTHMML